MKKIMNNKNKFRVLFLMIMPTLTKELSVMELVIAIIRLLKMMPALEVRVRKINI